MYLYTAGLCVRDGKHSAFVYTRHCASKLMLEKSLACLPWRAVQSAPGSALSVERLCVVSPANDGRSARNWRTRARSGRKQLPLEPFRRAFENCSTMSPLSSAFKA